MVARPDMITVKVLYFARAREIADTSEESYKIAAGRLQSML